MATSFSAFAARVLAFAREHALFAPGERVLAAVSGGADSMALLHVLLELEGALGITVAVGHFDHGIRAEASADDAAFVRAVCAALGVSCHAARGDVPSMRRGGGLEDAARRARYAFLDETAVKIGAQKIALGHQRRDQAETLLLHLAHGAGLAGLSGMRPLSGNRVRPLLSVSRAEIEAYLSARGVAWREDETNADPRFARNRVRLEVLPALERINPRAEEAIARTARLAARARDAEAARAEAGILGRLRRTSYGAFWRLSPGERPEPEAARAFLRFAGVPEPDMRLTDALCALAPGCLLNLPGGGRAMRTRLRLHAMTASEPVPPPRAEDFTWTPCDPSDLGDGVRTQTFDTDALEGAAFRFRRDGDTFAPLGCEGSQKLKQTLRDAGIDLPFRDHVPLLARGARVLWIVGLKPSRDAAVTPETRRAVKARYTGTLPWDDLPTTDGGMRDEP